MNEFEFHHSPACSSSRPHTGVGTDGIREKLTGLIRVVGQAAWALHGLGDVGDDAVAPAAQLVAEDPQSSRPAAADSAFADDATVGAVAVADRRRLDHEPTLRHAHLKRRVVEIASGPPRQPRRNRLVDLSVQPYRVTARTQR
jgi:hypothetical protein